MPVLLLNLIWCLLPAACLQPTCSDMDLVTAEAQRWSCPAGTAFNDASALASPPSNEACCKVRGTQQTRAVQPLGSMFAEQADMQPGASGFWCLEYCWLHRMGKKGLINESWSIAKINSTGFDHVISLLSYDCVIQVFLSCKVSVSSSATLYPQADSIDQCRIPLTRKLSKHSRNYRKS